MKPDLLVRSHPCHGTLYAVWVAEDSGAAPWPGEEPARRRWSG